MTTFPLKLSASAARSFETCEYRYARDYLAKLSDKEREPVTAFALGQAVHAAIASFFRLGGWKRKSLDDLIELCMRHWDSAAFPDEETSMNQFLLARELLENFYSEPYPLQVERELGLESFVSWSVPRRGLLAVGKLDRAVLLPDAIIEVIDYKTGRLRNTATELAQDLQSLFYRSLSADAFKRLAPRGIRLTYSYLASAERMTVEHTKEEFLKGWMAIEELANRIRHGQACFANGTPLELAFPPNSGDHCRFCPMRRHCRSLGFLAHPAVVPMLPRIEGGAA